MSTRITRRFAEAVLGHRALVLLGVAVATAVGAAGAGRMEPDFTFWNLLGSKSGELEQLQDLRRTFGEQTLNYIVLVEADDVLRPRVVEEIDVLTREIEDVDHVDEVVSLANLDDIVSTPDGFEVRPLIDDLPLDPADVEPVRARIGANRLLGGRLVSEDGRVAVLRARLSDSVERLEDRTPVVAEIRRVLDEADARGAPLGITYHRTGNPEMEQVYYDLGTGQRLRVSLLSLAAVATLLTLLYRSPWAVVFPVASLGVVIVLVTGLMGFTGGKLELLTSIIPSLLIVIGVADALHLISRYYEELREGRERDDALQAAVDHMTSACFFTSLTTSIGFASMVVSELPALRRFGLYTAAGVMLAYLVTITLTPILLSFVPAPRHPVRTRGRLDVWDRLFGWVADVSLRRAPLVVAITAVISVGALGLASQVEIHSRALQELRDDHPLVRATTLAEERLQGILAFEIDFDVEPGRAIDPAVLAEMDSLQRFLEQDPMVTSTTSIVDLLRQMNRALHDDDPAWDRVPDSAELAAQLLLLYSLSGDTEEIDELMTPARDRLHVTANLRDLGSAAFFPLLERVEPELERGLGRLDAVGEIRITGESYVAQMGIRKIVRSLLSSLGLAFVFILIGMSILFRSFRVGLVGMTPNVLPAASTLAAMVVLGLPLRMATSMIAAVALGIAVDDTIHMLVRIRTELLEDDADYSAAIRRAVMGTGRPILFTTLGLMAGYAFLLTGEFRAWVDFGILSAIAIGIALLVDVFFTPAVMKLVHPAFRKREA